MGLWKGGITHPKCKDCGTGIYYRRTYCRPCSLNHRPKGYHSKNMSGESNPMWKGNKAGYRSLHHWVEKWLGKAYECVYCGKNKLETRIHWASISHKAKRDLEDFISLCALCHHKYDRKLRIEI